MAKQYLPSTQNTFRSPLTIRLSRKSKKRFFRFLFKALELCLMITELIGRLHDMIGK